MNSVLGKLWRFLSLPKAFQLKVMRLSQDEFLIGVTGIILNDKNEILVCKHTYRQTKWSLPGGYLKTKEHPTEGLAREIEEETGFIVRIEKIIRTRTDRDSARLDMSCGEFRPSKEVSKASFFSFDNLPLLSRNQLLLIDEVLQRKTKILRDKSDTIKQFSLWEKIRSMMKR
jgi:ADP-ribose pyrophosphatase YjhB (NUDIX family)